MTHSAELKKLSLSKQENSNPTAPINNFSVKKTVPTIPLSGFVDPVRFLHELQF